MLYCLPQILKSMNGMVSRDLWSEEIFFPPKMSVLAIFGALCSGSIVVILPYISSPLGLRASNSIYTEMRTLFPTKLAKTLYSPIQHYIFSSFKRLLGYYTVVFLAPKKTAVPACRCWAITHEKLLSILGTRETHCSLHSD